VRHPSLQDVYTLGECITDGYPSEVGGPDTTRSSIVLYYGSFFRLSRTGAAFDWQTEIWDTLTHELQHHLESLASDDSLGEMDYAAEQNYRREDGEPFDPFFFRQGIVEGSWFRVEDEYFLEALEPVPGREVWFDWETRGYSVPAPDKPYDVAILTVTDGVIDAPPGLHIAVVKRRTWRDTLRDLLTKRAPIVVQVDVTAARDD
jgi:hypothetical protein